MFVIDYRYLKIVQTTNKILRKDRDSLVWTSKLTENTLGRKRRVETFNKRLTDSVQFRMDPESKE